MKLLNPIYILFCLCLLIVSCNSDKEITKEKAPEELIAEAKAYLKGEIILNTHATLNGQNKTLLPTGCPTKFKFEWDKKHQDVLTISLLNFTVGKMGMVVNFTCDIDIMQLISYEKDEYKGSGWVKLYGEDGATFGQDEEGKQHESKGSFVKGYYNVETYEINFIVDYNMMNVRSECFLQTIDKTRISNFEREFEQYENDLEEYKKQHGMS